MTDLFVDFGSNAGAVTREVDALAKAFDKSVSSTNAVAASTSKLAQQLKAEVGEMKRASAAAQEYAKSLRATQDLFTGGRKAGRQDGGGFAGAFGSSTGQLAGMKTSAMRALVNMNRDVRRTAEEGATQVAASWQKRLGQAIASGGGAIGSKLGGPLGGLLGRTGAQLGAGAAGLGAVGLATVGVAVAGIAVAWLAASTALAQYKERALGAVQATQFLADVTKQAQATRGASGSAWAESNGSSALLLIGQGAAAKGAADKFAGEFGSGDANAAVSAAQTRFGPRAAEAMGIASDVARITGKSVASEIGSLSPAELDNPDLARSRLLSIDRGSPNSGKYEAGDFAKAKANVDASAEGKNLITLRGLKGQGDVVAEGNVGAAVTAERGNLAAAKSPETKMILDAFNERQKALQQLVAVETGIDRLLYNLSLHMYTSGATGQVNAALSRPIGAQL